MTQKDRGVFFLVNARTQTLSAIYRKYSPPHGYLAPPSYLTKGVRKQLLELPGTPKPLILVDNGRFDDIQRIRKEYTKQSKSLSVAFAKAGISQASCPERNTLPVSIRAAADVLANKLADAAIGKSKAIDPNEQLSISPSSVVGIENITGALWHSAGLELSVITGGHKTIERQNRRNLRETASKKRKAILSKVHDMPVISATDYKSAFSAGKIIARSKIRRFCLPFGAFMADNRTTSSYVYGKHRILLESSVPARVLRSVLVAKGLADGWKSASGSPPEHIHLLGLGQMLILGLVAQAFSGVRTLTCDATSPFKDAASGSLYTSLPVFRCLNVDAVVWHLLHKKNGKWNCPCKWCKEHTARQDWIAARKWLKRNAHNLPSASHLPLKRNSELSKLLPYFSILPDKNTLDARIGHNHYIMQNCAEQLSSVWTSKIKLNSYVKATVKDYTEITSSTYYAKALITALDILKR